jgi:hypothetical protein
MIYLILTLILMILIQSFFNMIVWSNRRKITKKKFIIAVNKTILQICFGVCLVKSPFTIIT